MREPDGSGADGGGGGGGGGGGAAAPPGVVSSSSTPRLAPPRPRAPPGAPAAAPRMRPLSLTLEPPRLEAEFWGDCAARLAASDRWGLILGAAHAWVAGVTGSHRLMSAWPRRALIAAFCAVGLSSLAARGALWAWPGAWAGRRERVMVAQRVVRGGLMLCCLGFSTPAAWSAFLWRRSEPMDEFVVAGSLVSFFSVWLFHCVMFPMRLRRTAPIHAAICAAACWALRPFACTVKLNARHAAAAAALCRRLGAAMALALAAAGAVGPAGGAHGACDAREAEALIAFTAAAACLAPLYCLHALERAVKLDWLRARGAAGGAVHAAAAAAAGPGPSATGHALCVAVMLFVCFTIAEATALLGRPYAC